MSKSRLETLSLTVGATTAAVSHPQRAGPHNGVSGGELRIEIDVEGLFFK